MPVLWPPVIGICGYSGAGKTTLVETLVPRLAREGLSVAVVKHDAHGLTPDTRGKDTDRLYRAGADVGAHDSHQTFLRLHRPPEAPPQDTTLEEVVELLGRTCDLVLVEGHKGSSVPKLWLLSEGRSGPPRGLSEVLDVLPPGGQRTERALRAIRRRLQEFHRDLAVRVGVLLGVGEPPDVGGAARRLPPDPLGSTLLNSAGLGLETQLVRAARRLLSTTGPTRLGSLEPGLVLLGPGAWAVPHGGGPEGAPLLSLPAVTPGSGVLAQMAAAFRWAPGHRWLMLTEACLWAPARVAERLLGEARAGRWAVVADCAVLPHREPLAALYDPPMGLLFERALRREEPSLAEAWAAAPARVLHLYTNAREAGRPPEHTATPPKNRQGTPR